MTRQALVRASVLSASGCCAIAVGTAVGYGLGLTSIGQALPGALAAGTVLSLVAATFNAILRRRPVNQPTSGARFLIVTLWLCCIVLGSSISAPARWQLLPTDRVAGMLPYSDGCGYYKQVLTWSQPTFDQWNSRRPLNAALNVMEFRVGGSTLLGMSTVRAVLCALAIAAFVAALSASVGRAPALTAGFVLLFWAWPYASGLLSETNGIASSCAGYALLIAGIRTERRALMYAGLLGLALACGFRPYNPLMPAFVGMAAVMVSASDGRRSAKHAVGVGAAALALSILVPAVVFKAYGHPEGALNSNTGSVVLGLARGTEWGEAWTYVDGQHPGLTERQRNTLMYEMAARQFLQNPRPALGKVVRNAALSAYVFQMEVAAAMGVGRPVLFGDQGPRTGARVLDALMHRPDIWIAFFFTVASLAGIAGAAMRRDALRPWRGVEGAWLCVAAVISLATISPLIFGDSGWRGCAALYGGLSIVAAGIPMGIRRLREPHAESANSGNANGVQPEDIRMETRAAAGVALAVVVLMLAALPYPLVERLVGPSAPNPTASAVLDVRDGAVPNWTGSDRGVVSPKDLRNWAIQQRHWKLAAFVAEQGSAIENVRFDGEGFILTTRATAGVVDGTVLETAPPFLVRVRRE